MDGTGAGFPAPVLGESAALRMVVSGYGRLSALAADGTDLDDVARLLAETVASDVAVLGPTLAVQAFAVQAAGPADAAQDVVERLRAHAGRRGLAPVLTAAAGARRALTLPGSADPASAAVVAPITEGDDVTAYLVTFTPGAGGFGDDALLLLVEHAAMVCGVVLGRQRVVAAAAGRARQDLIEGVLNGRARVEGEVARWASHLGFDEGREHHVLVASVQRSDRARVHAVHSAIESYLGRHAPDAIVTIRDDEVVGIVPGPAGTAVTALEHVKRLAADCRSAVEARHPGVVTGIGIGGSATLATGISASYGQARRSLETTRRLGGGGVVAFAELGIQRLLLQVPDVAGLQAFAHEVLGAALDQDAGGGSEHLRTLSAFFRENGSPRRAAAGLHVHPNTVSYRIRRIEELTGLSLNDYRDRLLAQVAVEILLPAG